MKKRLIDISVAFMFGLSILLFFGYTRDWTESTPTDATVANLIDDYNRYVRVDVAERLEDYIGGFNASDTNEGFYHVLFIENAASLSTPAADKGLLYGLLSDSKCELAWMDEDGDELLFTYGGKHRIGSGTAPQAFMYNTTEEDTDGGRESTIRAKGEQSGGEVTTLGYIEFSHDGTSDDEKGRFRIMLNDGDDTDAPSKCPIEYASDGTIDVDNSVSVLDEDDMASDSNTVLTTQQSIKKYVDDAAGHDGDGYAYFDVDGSKTKVYTKYLTGTTDADAQTSIAHGVTGSQILSVSCAINDGSEYWAVAWKNTEALTYACTLQYDASNIYLNHGSVFRNKAYRIRIDYY